MRRMNIVCDVPVHAQTLQRILESGHSVDCITPPAEESRLLNPDRIRIADVLFCSMPPKNFDDLCCVRWIQLTSTGYSQLFDLGLPKMGVRATNSRGCFDVPIAEWNVAMMVNLARDLRGMIRNQEACRWDRSAVFQREIRGLVVGIWGYGGIGRETARLCHQLGLKIHVMTRTGVKKRTNVYCVPGTGDPEGRLPDRSYRPGEESEFLGELDFLIVALPLTKSSEGLIGERELRALPPRACVLNPARGPIIQESALIRALEEGWITGAALDAHFKYPMPADHPLWQFPNVILTPHISGSGQSPHFLRRVWEIFEFNLRRFANGEPLLNELTTTELCGG